MLNQQKGNMYGFVTHTWNTVKGECSHDCGYCYMKKWGKLNPVRFDNKELKTDLGENNFIFVGSSNDLFASDLPNDYIWNTINHCKKFKKNEYLFQTKNPNRMLFYQFPKHTTFIVTIESDIDYEDCKAPCIIDRLEAFKMIPKDHHRMITIEPIMDFTENFPEILIDAKPDQINIGADSGNNKLNEPDTSKIHYLITRLKASGIKVFLKDNLKRIYK